MKKLFCAMVFFAFASAGGVLGITFGQPIAEAEKILFAKGGKRDEVRENRHYYTNVIFAGKMSELVMLLVDNGKVIKAVIVTSPQLELDVFSSFDKLSKSITEKYGNPQTDVHEYFSPYERGDGYTHQAFRLEKAQRVCLWETNDMMIALQLQPEANEKFYINVMYEDVELFGAYAKKMEAKNNSDL